MSGSSSKGSALLCRDIVDGDSGVLAQAAEIDLAAARLPYAAGRARAPAAVSGKTTSVPPAARPSGAGAHRLVS
jgi:hypothetical protein